MDAAIAKQLAEQRRGMKVWMRSVVTMEAAFRWPNDGMEFALDSLPGVPPLSVAPLQMDNPDDLRWVHRSLKYRCKKIETYCLKEIIDGPRYLREPVVTNMTEVVEEALRQNQCLTPSAVILLMKLVSSKRYPGLMGILRKAWA
jgi:hypothetical protein